jgi:hypothetical protein
MLTLEAFRKVAKRYPKAASIWLDRLSQVSSSDMRESLERIPSSRISPTALEFAYQMLDINKSRLLCLLEDLS